MIQALPATPVSDNQAKDLVFVGTLKGHENKVLSVAFSPNGQILAAGSGDKTITLFPCR
ncbi:WD40 repeat domain-containing protein [Nodularia spumigena CS-584]|uniref:Uncharacterized protein n=2 Tax=Nodularia spumigena TaxID=70799 RepID=A0A2S0Q5F9_NODSP|nr:WD40 repeat domain-containing protein [Nodularia spumigena]AHJ26694.1 hypothetical protein NSP_3420 [Nodularia spumigena CCY9414]AVZ29955.1 hypothetical protein BMF81_01005 [Nodularia spumigena UHCC 0039]EAW43575.1 WD-40 repeat protein [Nodularia spumigena CCY9414]MDB9383873.1 WD40 repeat domain-containing protein [Nodularia spumigena CS-584]MEA5526193.1 WD40 repeat domain-containing protein [Nodularia spumigena UHCC 0143]